MTRGLSIDRGPTGDAVLAEAPVDCDMRRDRSISQFVHELRNVIALVRTERDPPCAIAIINENQRRG